MFDFLPIAAIVASGIAAVLGIMATRVQIRDSIDDYIADLHQQGRRAGWAAVAAGVAVALQSIDRLFQ